MTDRLKSEGAIRVWDRTLYSFGGFFQTIKLLMSIFVVF
jgi:hypothetical protein